MEISFEIIESKEISDCMVYIFKKKKLNETLVEPFLFSVLFSLHGLLVHMVLIVADSI